MSDRIDVSINDDTNDNSDNMKNVDVVSGDSFYKQLNREIVIDDGKHILLVGDTGTGKSNSLKWIMRDLCKNFDYGIVICGSGFINNDYDYIPSKYQYDYLPVDVLRSLVEDQKKRRSQEKKAKKIGREKPAPKVFIILDDIIGTFNRYGEGEIFNQITKWRHYNISTIWVLQDVKYLPPVVRNSCSIVFVTRVRDTNTESIYSLCSQGFKSFSHFKEHLNSNTKNYNLLMYDMTNPYEEKYIKILKPPKNVQLYKLKY